jgi:hypothetical protein
MNRMLTLKSKLYSLKMSEKTSIDEHLKAVSTLVGQLANISIVVLDEELVDRVLTNLPPNWKIFRTMTSNREIPVSYLELENLMLHKAVVRTREQEHDEEAFFVSHPSGGRYSNQRNNHGHSHFRGRKDQSFFGRGRFEFLDSVPYAHGAQHRPLQQNQDANRSSFPGQNRSFDFQPAPHDSATFGHL